MVYWQVPQEMGDNKETEGEAQKKQRGWHPILAVKMGRYEKTTTT